MPAAVEWKQDVIRNLNRDARVPEDWLEEQYRLGRVGFKQASRSRHSNAQMKTVLGTRRHKTPAHPYLIRHGSARFRTRPLPTGATWLTLSDVAAPDWPKRRLFHMPGAYNHVPNALSNRRNMSVRGTLSVSRGARMADNVLCNSGLQRLRTISFPTFETKALRASDRRNDVVVG